MSSIRTRRTGRWSGLLKLVPVVGLFGAAVPLPARGGEAPCRHGEVRCTFRSLARWPHTVTVITERSGDVVTIRWQRVRPGRRPVPQAIQVWPRPERGKLAVAETSRASGGNVRLAVQRKVETLPDSPAVEPRPRRLDHPRWGRAEAPEDRGFSRPGESPGPLERFLSFFASSAGETVPSQLHEAYQVWRTEEQRNEALQDHHARVDRLYRSFDLLMSEGLKAFRAGQWSIAANYFVAAAQSNRGDPVSRIHAGQALVAVGRYGEALEHIRRAVQLRPLLIRLPLDLGADYHDRQDFSAHVAGLAKYVKENPSDGEARLLLGFMRRFGGEIQAGYADLVAARRLKPRDPLAAALLKVTHVSK